MTSTGADPAMEVDSADRTEVALLPTAPSEPTMAESAVVAENSGQILTNSNSKDQDWADNLDGLLGLLEDDVDNSLLRARTKAYIQSQMEAAEEAVRASLQRGRSAYEAVLNNRLKQLSTMDDLTGGKGFNPSSTGSFTASGDGRHLAAINYSDVTSKTNWSFSFDPKSLVCHSCVSTRDHPVIGQHSGQRVPGIVVVISDHCFPAVLPATTDGHCIKNPQIGAGHPR